MKKLEQATATASPEDRAAFLNGYRTLLKRVRVEYQDPASHLELARFLIRHDRLGKAFSSLRVARALQPRRIETHYLIGWIHQREGNAGAAKAAYRQILRIEPQDARAHLALGRILEKEGDGPGAARAFRRVIAIDSGIAEAYSHLARIASRTGDHASALKQLTALAALEPNNHLVHHEMGKSFHALGVADRAILCLQAALAVAPDHLPSKLALASVYLDGKAHPQAAALLDEVIARWPRTPDVYLLLARLHLDSDKRPQALADLLQFQKIFPLDHRGSYEMGRIYALQGDLEMAGTELAKALEMAPERAEIYAELGRVHERGGEQEKAIRLGLLMCERFPEDPASYERLAEIHERFAMLPEATAAIGRAIALAPRQEQLFCKRARWHIQAGSYNDAVLDFQKAREIDPDCPDAQLDTELIRGHQTERKAFEMNGRAREAVERGDFAQALSLYRQVIQLVPDNALWLRDMLGVFVSLGQFRDATGVLETLLALEPSDAALCRRAAQFHYQLGNFDPAFRLFEKTVALDGADVLARVHVLRSLAHRFLARTVEVDRYPALLAAYEENLRTARDPELARLELGYFHLAVGRHVATGAAWRASARQELEAVGERAGRDVYRWRLRGLLELALLEGNDTSVRELTWRLAELTPGDAATAGAHCDTLLEGPPPSAAEVERARGLCERNNGNGYLRSMNMRLFRRLLPAGIDARTALRKEIRRYQLVVSEERVGAVGFLDLGLALRFLAPRGEWNECSRKSDIAFGKAASLDPSSVWPWWGMVENAAGAPGGGEQRPDRSRLAAVGSQALRKFPREPLLHWHVGESRVGGNDVSEQESGVDALTCATLLSPEMAPAHLALARHHGRMNQGQTALHHYVRVMECLAGPGPAAQARVEMSKLV